MTTRGRSKIRRKVLVIVHDAGGAEIISAYIRAHKNGTDFQSYVAGPATAIFRRERIRFFRITENRIAIARLMKKHADVDCVILGAPWRTRIESIALAEAKKEKIRTIVYMDSWSNYRERFGYPSPDWRNHLPDELWVGDIKAQSLAKLLFPKSLPIKLVPNQYVASLKKRYKTIRKKRPGHTTVLFLTDPSADSLIAIQLLATELSGMDSRAYLRIRVHPSDEISRFKRLKSRFPRLKIQFSRNPDLAQDLGVATVVIGANTVGLAVASAVELPVLCVASQKNDILPRDAKITRIRTARELTRHLKSIL